MTDKLQLAELDPEWYEAVESPTRDPEAVLEVLKKRAFDGGPIIARVASGPTQSLRALQEAAGEALGTDDIIEINSAIKDAYQCTWGLYSIAFYEKAMACSGGEHDFTNESLLPAVKNGLDTIINMGGIMVGTMRPEAMITDENNVLHCETGPAIIWGEDLFYYWRGTEIEAKWVEDRKNRTASEAISEPNMEKRNAYCEILGWHLILDELNARVIQEDADPMIGSLMEVDLPDAPNSRFLKVKCGTGRTFALSVPNDIDTAIQAQAWGYDITEAQAREVAKYRT